MPSVWVFLINVVVVLATIVVVMIVHPLGWVGLAILAAMFGGLPRSRREPGVACAACVTLWNKPCHAC